jgi:hypothetical protein
MKPYSRDLRLAEQFGSLASSLAAFSARRINLYEHRYDNIVP